MKTKKMLTHKAKKENHHWIPFTTFVDIAQKTDFSPQLVKQMFDSIGRNEYLGSDNSLATQKYDFCRGR